jgi:hypothetical protein
MAIAAMNKKFQVFISSTFRDLIAERQAAIRAVLDLGHIPSGMEMFPAADVEQFEYIKKVVDECDYYVLIIGARYGSVDATGLSFTEKEYDYAVKTKKTVLAFIQDDTDSLTNKVDTDPASAAKLKAFREKVRKGRLVQHWSDKEPLISKIYPALSRAFQDMPAIGWIRGDTAASEDLLAQNNVLRNRLDETLAENHNLRQQMEPQLQGIAGFGDWFEFRYSHEYYSHHNTRKDTHKIALTWGEIFAACGPALFRPTSPAVIEGRVLAYLQQNRHIPHQGILSLFSSDQDRIKIQLAALGLIIIDAAEAKGGGIAEFISLTPQGKSRLLELLAVKGTATSPVAPAPGLLNEWVLDGVFGAPPPNFSKKT